jgi:hypothetical protein
MSVHVALRGNLGNNLFQYAIGRIIAEHHGYALECCTRPFGATQPGRFVKFSGPATLEGLALHFPLAPLRRPGRCVDAPVEQYDVDGDRNAWNGQRIDLAEILRNPSPRQIRLHGYFQRMEYYAPYADQLRQWFTPRSVGVPFEASPRDVVVSVREEDDYGVFGWVLPLSYYHEALGRIPLRGRVFVCSSRFSRRLREGLAEYSPIFVPGTPIQQFRFMTRFKTLVLSNSTFAWWAGFLSSAGCIYSARAATGKGYAFTGFGDVDLHMRTDEFHEIEVTQFARTELLVQSQMLSAELFESRDHTVVCRRSQPAVRLLAPRRLLSRLAQVSTLGASDLLPLCDGSDPALVIALLARSGLIALGATYTEPR